MSGEFLPTPPAVAKTLRAGISATLRHRGVQGAAVAWVLGYVAVLSLAGGSLPFDRPALAALPFVVQMAAPSIGMIEVLLLMVMAYLLTRRRPVPDISARAPELRVARRETAYLLFTRPLAKSVAGCWGRRSATGRSAFTSLALSSAAV